MQTGSLYTYQTNERIITPRLIRLDSTYDELVVIIPEDLSGLNRVQMMAHVM